METRLVNPAAAEDAAAGLDPSIVGATPQWIKVGNAISYTTFSTAGTTKSNTLFTLPIAGVMHSVKLKPSTAFSGGAINAMTLSVGISGTNDKYLTAFDVFQAVSGTAFGISDGLFTESHTATATITISAISTGANLSALTAGVVDVWVLMSVAL